jgi:hypothetical protein
LIVQRPARKHHLPDDHGLVCARLAQDGHGFLVQGGAHRQGKLVVDGLPDQIVSEGESASRRSQKPGIPGAVHGGQQRTDRFAEHPGHGAEVEFTAEDRADLEEAHRVLGQAVQSCFDTAAEAGRYLLAQGGRDAVRDGDRVGVAQ